MRTVLRRVLAGLIIFLSASGAALTTLRFWPRFQTVSVPVAMAAAFIPYAALAWFVAGCLLFLMASKPRKKLAVLFLIPLGFHITGSGFSCAEPPHAPEGTPVRVLFSNAKFGQASPKSLGDLIERERPEIVVIAEIQEPLEAALQTSGALDPFPFRVGNVEPGYAQVGYNEAKGTLVLSRFPIMASERLPTHFGQYVVRVELPGNSLVVVAAHSANLNQGLDAWTSEAQVLRETAERHKSEPVLVVGDLNSVSDHITMRDFADAGMHEISRDTGAWWLPTYPADSRIPPVIQIDHMLGNAHVHGRSIRAIQIPRTDHLGLIAEVIVTPC